MTFCTPIFAVLSMPQVTGVRVASFIALFLAASVANRPRARHAVPYMARRNYALLTVLISAPERINAG